MASSRLCWCLKALSGSRSDCRKSSFAGQLSRADWQGSRDSAFQAAAFPHVHVASESQAGLFGVTSDGNSLMQPEAKRRTAQSYMKGLWSYTVWIRFWFCHFLVGCSTGSYLNSLCLSFLTYKRGRRKERKQLAALGFSGKLNEFIHVECLLLSWWEGSWNWDTVAVITVSTGGSPWVIRGQEIQPGFRSDWMEELENRLSETVLFHCLYLWWLSSLFPRVYLVPLSLAFSACVYPGSAMVFLTILNTIFHLGQITSLRSSSKFLG